MAKTDLLQTAIHCHSLGYQVIPLRTPNLHGQGCLQHRFKCVHLGKVLLTNWKDLMLGRGQIKETRGR